MNLFTYFVFVWIQLIQMCVISLLFYNPNITNLSLSITCLAQRADLHHRQLAGRLPVLPQQCHSDQVVVLRSDGCGAAVAAAAARRAALYQRRALGAVAQPAPAPAVVDCRNGRFGGGGVQQQPTNGATARTGTASATPATSCVRVETCLGGCVSVCV